MKRDYNLDDIRDIVWMKFLDTGHLGVVATSNDINFDLPENEEDYTRKVILNNSEKYGWEYNTSGILLHQIGRKWDTSFVLVFPIPHILGTKYRRGEIERGIGNYLIDQGVPIIDFYSHNY